MEAHKKEIKTSLILLCLGLMMAGTAAIFQPAPGYMDAEYYYSGGVRLAEGDGFTENFLWNYLDNPSGLPHPAFTYWMPFPSLLAALGMLLTGMNNFWGAKVFFIILGACIPVITYTLQRRIMNNNSSLFSACLSLFPGFYMLYVSNTETFTPYLVLGGIFWILCSAPNISKKQSFLLGIIAGLLHLTRADGLLWLAGALGFEAYRAVDRQIKDDGKFIPKNTVSNLKSLLIIFLGYLIVMSPWYGRNIRQFGTLFSPGGAATLWITNYNQTFVYPADKISITNWIQAGWPQHFQTWWSALKTNLITTLAVQGEIFLLPFILVGAWRLGKNRLVLFSGLMWLVTLIVMSFVFPFAGARGGFLHSGAVFQILFWVLAGEGLRGCIIFGIKWRGWNFSTAWKFFSTSFVALSIFLTVYLYISRVFGPDILNPQWAVSEKNYQQVETKIDQLGFGKNDVVMINNPPGYYAANRRPAIVIPDGDEFTMMQAAKRYQAKILVLDQNYPAALMDFYTTPKSIPGLEYIETFGQSVIYRFVHE